MWVVLTLHTTVFVWTTVVLKDPVFITIAQGSQCNTNIEGLVCFDKECCS